MAQKNLEKLIPHHEFMYTVEQIGHLLGLSESNIYNNYLWYPDKPNQRAYSPKKMRASDIRSEGAARPKWRVAHGEYMRWLKHHGVKV